MKILIVKCAALGDVVRTSYFCRPLRQKYDRDLKLFWVTGSAAVPLLARNPYIDHVVTRFDEILSEQFDIVYSLDDEIEVLGGVNRLRATRLVGAYLKDGHAIYSEDSAAWFDMGLRSRFGKLRADELKKFNTRTHAEIFSEIFGVAKVEPSFHGDPRLERTYGEWLGSCKPVVGINPFAGERWPTKELRGPELEAFISALLGPKSLLSNRGRIILIGAGRDREKNLELCLKFSDSRIGVANTDASPLHLAALIHHLDFMVSSDSLAMHLAIAQGVPTVAFFAPTSGAEIDDFGYVRKIISTAPDYCSYRKDADNSTITHLRLWEALKDLHQQSALA